MTILNYKLKIVIFIIQIGLLCSFPVISANAQPTEGFASYQADYCTVYFQPGVNLNKVDRNINIRFIDLGSYNKGLIYQAKTREERIGLKCDFIVLKSRQILDMYPSDFHVSVIFYKDKKGLINAYKNIMGEEEDLYSFYVYETNTIYTTQDRINQNVLAHEIGHALVDYYFIVRPPHSIREMISQHLDVHLED